MAERDVPEELRRKPVKEVATVDGDVTVVRLAGQLDLHNAEDVRRAILVVVEAGPERLVVDLEEVTFVDSTALGILVEARRLLGDGNAFLLAAPGVECRRALEVSGLDRHFGVHATVDDALGAAR